MAVTPQDETRGNVRRLARREPRPLAAEPSPNGSATVHDWPQTLEQQLTADLANCNASDHMLNSTKYTQGLAPGRANLYAWSSQGTPEPYQLARGVLSVPSASLLRDLNADREPDTKLTDAVFDVEYRPDAEHRPDDVYKAQLSAIDRDARDPQWPDPLGLRARTSKKRLAAIGDALTAMAATLELPDGPGWQHAYACSGLMRQGPGYVFLRPGKPALTALGTDPALTCVYPQGIGNQPGIEPLDFAEPSGPETEEKDLLTLMRIADLTPREPGIAMALITALAWAPVATLRQYGRLATLLTAETGLGKTSLCGLLIAAQSSTYVAAKGQEPPVTAKARGNQSTVFGTDQLLYPLSGLLAIVDDWFADQMTAKEVAESWRRLSLIGDNVATGSGGTRGGYRNGRANLANAVYPRASIIATAERTPDEAEHSSATARYTMLHMSAPPNYVSLTELQAESRAIARAHARNIQSLLPGVELPKDALKWGQETAESWALGGHARVLYGYSRHLAGGYLLGERMRDVLGLDPALWLTDAAEVLRDTASGQTRRSGMRNGRDIARDPVRLFRENFCRVIAGEPCWLADPDMSVSGDTHSVPMLPGFSPHAVGWRQSGSAPGHEPSLMPYGKGAPSGAVWAHDPGSPGRVPWRPLMARIPVSQWERLFGEIQQSVKAERWSLPADDEMRDLLTSAGIMRSSKSAQPPAAFWGSKPHCYTLDLGALLAGDDDDGQDDDNTAEPEPAEPAETCVIAGKATPAVRCPGCGGLRPADLAVNGYHVTCEPASPEPEPEPPLPPEPTFDDIPPDDDSPDQAEPEPEHGQEPPGATGVADDTPEPAEPAQSRTEPPASPSPAASPPRSARPAGPPRPAVRSRARTTNHRYAVIDTDGLWTDPESGKPRPVPLPATRSDAYAVARQEQIKQLWFTPRAAAALDLTTPDDRPDIPIDAGSEHPWADSPAALDSDPIGIAPWMAVWNREATRRASAHSVVLPHLETRASFAYDGNGDPWPDLDGPTLLAAVELVSDALGSQEDYYRSPNSTTAAMAKRHCPRLAPCYAILRGEVLPAREHPLLLPGYWQRPFADVERQAHCGLCRIDRNAAYLSAMATMLGIGEPRHTGPVDFDPAKAGYYRLSRQPVTYDPLLPPLAVKPLSDGGLWITAQDATLLWELGILPPIAEAWLWDQTFKVLRPLYERINKARIHIAPVKATPAGRIAWRVIGDMYKSWTGYLARTDGPRSEHDALYRPDYRDALKGEAGARMMRNLIKCRDESGRTPVATYVDAAYYTIANRDDLPAGLTFDPLRGGAWKIEGFAALADVIGKPRLQDAFDAAMKRDARKAR